MDNSEKEEIQYLEHYGIQLGAVKIADKPPEDVELNRIRLIALTGYLVSQEHFFRIEVTKHLIRLTIKDTAIEGIWDMEPSVIQKFILEHAWQGPIGLHGPVVHLKIEAKVNGNGQNGEKENPDVA